MLDRRPLGATTMWHRQADRRWPPRHPSIDVPGVGLPRGRLRDFSWISALPRVVRPVGIPVPGIAAAAMCSGRHRQRRPPRPRRSASWRRRCVPGPVLHRMQQCADQGVHDSSHAEALADAGPGTAGPAGRVQRPITASSGDTYSARIGTECRDSHLLCSLRSAEEKGGDAGRRSRRARTGSDGSRAPADVLDRTGWIRPHSQTRL